MAEVFFAAWLRWQHCAFTFWLGSRLNDPIKYLQVEKELRWDIWVNKNASGFPRMKF